MTLFRFQPSEENEDLGPPPGPFQFRRRPNWRLPGGLVRWAGVLVILIVLYSVASIAKGLYADWLWFESVEYRSVYRLRLVTRIWLFFAGAGVFLLFFGANVLVALRVAARGVNGSFLALIDAELGAVRRIVLVVAVAAALFVAVIFGTQAAGQWDSILLYMNSQSFGEKDPAFSQDIGFYVFQLPALNFILGWSLGVVILTTVVVGGLYAVRMLLGGFSSESPRLARPHVSLLLVVVVGLFVWRYWLGRFALVYSERGSAFGAGWTDINAQLPVIYVLMGFASFTALCLLISIFRRGLLFLPIGAVVLWVVAAIVGGAIYPATVQQFQVKPNELAKEGEFIQRNIKATRAAYGLEPCEAGGNGAVSGSIQTSGAASVLGCIEVRPFPARDSGVTRQEIDNNPETIDNIRLWDHRPLRDTLNQRQAFGPLYDFLGVDVDRYEIDGELRQVMLAARELDQTSLPEDKKSWVNERLKFTHGFGLAMVPVNEVAPGGGPQYFVEEIPPVGKLEIEQPRVYYGEIPEHYVIVKSDEEEFDFPIGGDRGETTTYDGEGGVRLNSFLRRLVYAWEFGDYNILISDAINDESLLLYRRNIQDRISEIAPFLLLDHDPYLVVADGKLFWIQDAYTHTDRYPYSTRLGGLNYIRNSVKVVVSAFDGTTTFYRIDPDDPIAQVYQGIYPDLFTPFDEMPDSLRAHIRYPQDLFQVQAQLYLRYHIGDARDFFLGEGFWEIPTERFFDQEQPLEPYYVIMRLPGEERAEFVLILPFRPRGERKNSIAWLAARSDGDQYGKLLAFRFPTGTDILGPSQVESLIDREPTISQQLTLWDQSGSQVIRGNLLMIPIGEGNLFVEPIYLQATASRLPGLERVVVVRNDNDIAMEETLERALDVVLGRAEASAPTVEPGEGAPSPTPVATPAEGETPAATPTAEPTPGLPDDVETLIQEANTVFERAQQRLQQGDFAGYGEEIERLAEILQRLGELTALGE